MAAFALTRLLCATLLAECVLAATPATAAAPAAAIEVCAPPPLPPQPQRAMDALPSEWRTRRDGTRCVDFHVRANSSYWPAYRSAHVLHNAAGEGGFTAATRASIVAMGEAVAGASGGWRTDRHRLYPTTDFSVKSDLPPRFAEGVFALAREWVLPHVASIAGVFAPDLRLDDLFVVKYEVKPDGTSQQHLAPHEDGSTWTFSMGLNSASEYEGGGCRFHGHGIGDVHSSPTTTLIHYGQLRHEGLRITRGKRYLLVGFVYHVNDCSYD